MLQIMAAPNLLLMRIHGSRLNSNIYHCGDGCYYFWNHESFTSTYFRCVKSGQGCGGGAVLRPGLGLPLNCTQPHDHPPDASYGDYLAARGRILDSARSLTYVSLAEILEEEKRRLGNDRALRLQLTYRRMRSAMQRARASVFPRVPANLEELTAIMQDPAWVSLTQTHDLEDSLYCGSVTARDGSHHVLFISRRCIEILQEVRILFADGTFYIAPSIDSCYQIIPLAWCLMQRKTENAYISVLELLRSKLVHWQLSKVVCDYEDAMMKAFSKVFPVDVQGCLFHSAHAMASWAKTNITVNILNQYPAIQGIVHLFCALPFLPQHLLQRGLNAVGAYAMSLGAYLYTTARPFLQYIQNDWLNHVNRGHTMSACLSEHRTDNPNESNNRRMKSRIRVHHPNIYSLIRHFVNFEDTSIDDLLSLRCGLVPNRHRAVTVINNDARVQALTRNFLLLPVPTDDQIMDLLPGVSHSVQNVVDEDMHLPVPSPVN